jgi:hypothetical protein
VVETGINDREQDMHQWQWWAPISVLFVISQWVLLIRSNERLQRRVRILEIRLDKIQQHIGFVADPTECIMEDVKVLARTPGSKIAAIKLYRDQTGAGLREAKDAIERMERS